MKKAFKIALLVTALALAMTVSAAASYTDFKAVPVGNVITPTGGKYTVTATNSGASEAQCVVLVLKGLWEQADFATAGTVPLTADSILYIDQKAVPAKTGATDGTETFTVYPKSLPDSTVILTGLNEKPQVVGYTEGKGVTVSGKVGGTKGATVALGTGDRLNFVATYTTTSASDTTFTFESVLPGDYALEISKKYFITYYKESVTVTDGGGSLREKYYLYGGDINSDNAVNPVDLSIFIADYGATKTNPPKNPGSDINADEAVNGVDLSILISSFGKSAEKVAQ